MSPNSKTVDYPKSLTTSKQINDQVYRILNYDEFLGKNPLVNPDIALEIKSSIQFIEFFEDFFFHLDNLFDPQAPYLKFIRTKYEDILKPYSKLKSDWNVIKLKIESNEAGWSRKMIDFIPEVKYFVSNLIYELDLEEPDQDDRSIAEAARSKAGNTIAKPL